MTRANAHSDGIIFNKRPDMRCYFVIFENAKIQLVKLVEDIEKIKKLWDKAEGRFLGWPDSVLYHSLQLK